MATLQQIQAVELEMLHFLHDRCAALGINYCITDGTMLGAIRHQGFIPWDDDLDIYMSMEDFSVFRKSFQSDDFFLQMPENEKEFASICFKIRKNGTVMKVRGRESLDIHHGVWLDIFPYTNAGGNRITRKLQIFFRNMLQSFRLKWHYKRTAPQRKLHVLLCFLPFRVSLWIDRLLYKAIALLGSKSSDQIFALDVGRNMFFKKSFFENTQLYRFEDGEFWGIRDYDEYLTLQYGPDYMTPVKWGHVEDYSTVTLT